MSNNKPLNLMDFKLNSGTDIPLFHNPFDLRPAITAILSRVENVRKNLNGQPLVILMGEKHPVSSHVMLQYLTLSKLHQHYGSKVGFGAEMPWNIGSRPLVKKGYTAEQVKLLLENDFDGQKTLSEILSYDSVTHAPISHSSLLRHCLGRLISTCFADVAEDPEDDSLLDLEDKVNKIYLQNLGLKDIGAIRLTSPLGMAFRNVVMADRVVQHMRAAKLDIMVIGTGAGHIYGYEQAHDNSYALEGSLAARFDEMNIPFLSVLPFKNAISVGAIPRKATKYFGQTIAVTQIDEKHFEGQDSATEIQYMMRVMEQSGMTAKKVEPAPLFK